MRSKLFVLIISFLVSITAAEVFLLKWHKIVPGVTADSQWFRKVDSLVSFRGFIADSEGVFKVEPDAGPYLHQRIANYTFDKLPPHTISNFVWEIYGLDGDYLEVQQPNYHSTFADTLRNWKAFPANDIDSFKSALVNYSTHPINQDGFRSIPFVKNCDTTRKKILLLGDSFTYGHAAKNKLSSFADILLAEGYWVYNTGISGSDVPQYLALAKKYITALKPDAVIINFCMLNDVRFYPRDVKPYLPIFDATNGGHVYRCPSGIYFKNTQEAYNYVLSQLTIPPNNYFNRLCAKTALGTLLWMALSKCNLASKIPDSYNHYFDVTGRLISQVPYCNAELKEIERLCLKSETKFLLVAIPEQRGNSLIWPENVPHLFDGLNYYKPPVTLSDFNTDNFHYNEEGHRKHAKFIEFLINK